MAVTTDSAGVTFPYSMTPISNITPFTYRDGATYLEILERLAEYVDSTLRGEFTTQIAAARDEFATAIGNAETVIVNSIEEFNTLYDAFTAEINRQVMLINNRVGPENIQRRTLTANYNLTVDPAWPTAHPILHQFTQDATGGRTVTLGTGLSGPFTINPAPGARSEFWLIPDGTAWRVWQPAAEITSLISAQAEPKLPAGGASQFLAGDRVFKDVTKTTIGLGNVDNTADLNKPVSTPMETRFRHRLYTLWDKPLDRIGTELMRLDTSPFVWVNCGSSTAAGGVVDRVSQSWFTRVGHMMGQTAGYVDIGAIDATMVPANGWYGVKAAVGGTTSANYLDLATIEKINSLKPDIVSHMVGSNDWSNGTAVATYKANIRNNVQSIRNANPATTQLLIHQNGRLDGTRAIPWKDYGKGLKEVAEEFPDTCVFVDLDQHFRFMGIPSSNSWGLIVSDNLHMNPAGNKLIADFLCEYLGLPSSRMLGVESYETNTFTGGTFDTTGNGNTLASITIPPKPYIRNIHATAAIFTSVPSGYNDITMSPDAALSASSSQVLRVSNTASSTQGWTGRFIVEPYATGKLNLFLNIYNAPSITVSSNASYNSFVATAAPGF